MMQAEQNLEIIFLANLDNKTNPFYVHLALVISCFWDKFRSLDDCISIFIAETCTKVQNKRQDKARNSSIIVIPTSSYDAKQYRFILLYVHKNLRVPNK